MPLRNAIILTDAGSGVNTFFRGGGKFFRGGGALRATTKTGGAGNRLGGDWRGVPFPLLRASSRAEGKSAPTLWVSRPRRTRKPACGGTRKDRCAVRTKWCLTRRNYISRRPKTVFVAARSACTALIGPLFDFDFWIGRKIDEQPEAAMRKPKVVHELGTMFLRQTFDCLDFHDDLAEAV